MSDNKAIVKKPIDRDDTDQDGGDMEADVRQPDAKRAKFSDEPVGIIINEEKEGARAVVAPVDSRAFQLRESFTKICASAHKQLGVQATPVPVLCRVAIEMPEITRREVWGMETTGCSEFQSIYGLSGSRLTCVRDISREIDLCRYTSPAVDLKYVHPTVASAVAIRNRRIYHRWIGGVFIRSETPDSCSCWGLSLKLHGDLDPNTHYMGETSDIHFTSGITATQLNLRFEPSDQDWFTTFGTRCTREDAIRFVTRITRRKLPVKAVLHIVDQFCILPYEAKASAKRWKDERDEEYALNE